MEAKNRDHATRLRVRNWFFSGLLAHELTHIRNADITLMFTATVIGGWIEFWGDAIRTTVSRLLKNQLRSRNLVA